MMAMPEREVRRGLGRQSVYDCRDGIADSSLVKGGIARKAERAAYRLARRELCLCSIFRTYQCMPVCSGNGERWRLLLALVLALMW